MTRISATEVMIEHNTKLARDPKHLRRLVSFWPEENIVHQLAKQALADMAVQKKIAANTATTAIPDGWMLVPIEPTQEMIWAAKEALSNTVGWDSFIRAHKAMLTAAPEAGK